MTKNSKFIVFLCLVFTFCLANESLAQLKKGTKKSVKKTYQYTYCGQVFLKKANFQPSPDVPLEPKGIPFKTKVLIYSLMDNNKVNSNKTSQQIVYSKTQKVIKTVNSDENGSFCAKLKYGKYSFVFLNEHQQMVAISFDAKGDKMYINPVQIGKKYPKTGEFVIMATEKQNLEQN